MVNLSPRLPIKQQVIEATETLIENVKEEKPVVETSKRRIDLVTENTDVEKRLFINTLTNSTV